MPKPLIRAAWWRCSDGGVRYFLRRSGDFKANLLCSALPPSTLLHCDGCSSLVRRLFLAHKIQSKLGTEIYTFVSSFLVWQGREGEGEKKTTARIELVLRLPSGLPMSRRYFRTAVSSSAPHRHRLLGCVCAVCVCQARPLAAAFTLLSLSHRGSSGAHPDRRMKKTDFSKS